MSGFQQDFFQKFSQSLWISQKILPEVFITFSREFSLDSHRCSGWNSWIKPGRNFRRNPWWNFWRNLKNNSCRYPRRNSWSNPERNSRRNLRSDSCSISLESTVPQRYSSNARTCVSLLSTRGRIDTEPDKISFSSTVIGMYLPTYVAI